MLYVGGLRPRHVIGAYEDLGMQITGTGYEFGHADDYQRTLPLVKDGTVIYDDATEHEMEELVKHLKPDLVGAGIKEKYVFQKMGVPFRQMHSWDYSGPYHGYEGFPIFARDMDMAINSPTWKLVKDPFAAPCWSGQGFAEGESRRASTELTSRDFEKALTKLTQLSPDEVRKFRLLFFSDSPVEQRQGLNVLLQKVGTLSLQAGGLLRLALLSPDASVRWMSLHILARDRSAPPPLVLVKAPAPRRACPPRYRTPVAGRHLPDRRRVPMQAAENGPSAAFRFTLRHCGAHQCASFLRTRAPCTWTILGCLHVPIFTALAGKRPGIVPKRTTLSLNNIRVGRTRKRQRQLHTQLIVDTGFFSLAASGTAIAVVVRRACNPARRDTR